MDIRCTSCQKMNRVPSLGYDKKAVCAKCGAVLKHGPSSEQLMRKVAVELEREEQAKKKPQANPPARTRTTTTTAPARPAAPTPRHEPERRKPRPAQHLETFQTSQGTVIVAWMDERETHVRNAKAAVLLGGIIQQAFNKKIISDEILEGAGSASGDTYFDEVKRSIGNILKAKPRADLRDYEEHLQIEITLQEGPLGKASDSPLFNADSKLSGMRAIAEIDRFYEQHKEQFTGPGSSQRVREAFQNMINSHKARILEEMK